MSEEQLVSVVSTSGAVDDAEVLTEQAEDTSAKPLTIEDVVDIPKTGISNEVMRPAIRRWIGNPEALTLLHDTYTDQFNHTRRYLTVAETKVVNELFGEYREDPEKLALVAQLKPSHAGVTRRLVADTLAKALAERDVRTIILLRKHFPKIFAGAMERLRTVDREAIKDGLARVDMKVAAGELKL